MAIITDVQDLVQSTTADGSSNDGNIFIDTAAKTIKILTTETNLTKSYSVSDLEVKDSGTLVGTLESVGGHLPSAAVGDVITLTNCDLSANNMAWTVTAATTDKTLYVCSTPTDPTDDVNSNVVVATIPTEVDLDTDGVTLQALYSFLKEEWKLDATKIKFPFPMTAITPEQFEFQEDWTPVDDATRKLIRTGGWAEIDGDGVTQKEFVGVITLGSIDSADTVYYFFDDDTAVTPFTYSGPVNEVVQTYDADGDNDKTKVLTVRIRVFGKTYDQSTTPDIGISEGSTITYKVERFPLSEGTDPVISDLGVSSGDIDSNTPYTDMTIAYFDAEQTRSGFTAVGGDTPSPGDTQFGVIIDADVSEASYYGDGVATAEQIYAFVQRQLIRDTDINDGSGSSTDTVIGRLAEPLVSLASTGNTLSTIELTANPVNSGAAGTGVYIDSFSDDDKNRVQFIDNDSDTRTFPYVASGSINFNDYLVSDTKGYYWMFYQYTASTTEITDLDITISGSSDGKADISTTGAGNLPALIVGDYIELSGCSNAVNNVVWEVTGVNTSEQDYECILYHYNGTDEPVSETPASANVYEHPINSPDAVLVDNESDNDIEGEITSSSVTFQYDYDGNTQEGRSSGTPAPVLLRAIGYETAQFIEATGTISRSTGQTFTLVAGLERNYYNEVE